nr:hypothetical protein HmN_000249600 [Hymenolepis microstoma]CUU97643.1 hypothetical transcript [Hymenolepis microstoma]
MCLLASRKRPLISFSRSPKHIHIDQASTRLIHLIVTIPCALSFISPRQFYPLMFVVSLSPTPILTATTTPTTPILSFGLLKVTDT